MRAVGVRLPGAVLAALGALLALPSVFWPTVTVSITAPEPSGLDVKGPQIFSFEMWSWGKVFAEGLVTEGGQGDGSTGRLSLLVAAVVVALTAAALLGLARTAAVVPLGVAALGFSTAIVATSMVERVTRDGADFGATGATVENIATVAGLLETGAVALLALALVLLLSGPAWLTAVDLGDRFRRRGRRHEPQEPGEDDARAEVETAPSTLTPTPRVRDTGLREGRRTAGPVEGVGFSDD